MSDRPILFSGPMVRATLDGRKTQTRRAIDIKRYAATLRGHSTTGRLVAYDGDRHGLEFVHDELGLWNVESNPKGRSGWYVPVRFNVGQRLWVREAWRVDGWDEDCYVDIRYQADGQYMPGIHGGKEADLLVERTCARLDKVGCPRMANGNYVGVEGLGYRPSIHMPRWASRLTLTVTGVKVERLNDISEDDAAAEGIETDAWDMAPVARRYDVPDGWFVGWPDCCSEPSISVDAETVCRRSFATLWNSIHGKDAWEANPWCAAITFTAEQRNIDQPITDKAA